jgi:hypothetical protein
MKGFDDERIRGTRFIRGSSIIVKSYEFKFRRCTAYLPTMS